MKKDGNLTLNKLNKLYKEAKKFSSLKCEFCNKKSVYLIFADNMILGYLCEDHKI